jgi:hypothetical protein
MNPAKPTEAKKSRLVTILLSILIVVLVVAAAVLVWRAFAAPAVDVSAPLPEAEFQQPAGGPPVGPTGAEPVPVDDGLPMTAEQMAPSTLFIPALGVYMPVEADSTFVSSKYAGFNTLRVPKNPKHGVWYAAGAPMAGGGEGTTLVASHVSTSSGWGALRYLYKIKAGELIYTKDAHGQLQAWQMSQMRVELHTAFPQDYWSAKGERRLVVTTCGGKVSHGLFTQNLFAIATPVATPSAAPPSA